MPPIAQYPQVMRKLKKEKRGKEGYAQHYPATFEAPSTFNLAPSVSSYQ